MNIITVTLSHDNIPCPHIHDSIIITAALSHDNIPGPHIHDAIKPITITASQCSIIGLFKDGSFVVVHAL